MNTVLSYGKLGASEFVATSFAVVAALGLASTVGKVADLFTKGVRDFSEQTKLDSGLQWLNSYVPQVIKNQTDNAVEFVQENIPNDNHDSYKVQGLSLLKSAAIATAFFFAARYVPSERIVVNTALNAFNTAQRWVFSKI